jgi:hypothetical protein
MSDDEGLELMTVFKGRFATMERANARGEREKRLAETPKQRARRGPRVEPRVQINFRATRATKALIAALATKLNTSANDVICRAIAELGERMGDGK